MTMSYKSVGHMIRSRIYFGVYHELIDMLQGPPVAVVRQGMVGEGGELITSESIVTRGVIGWVDKNEY